jgi:hypothetical protein
MIGRGLTFDKRMLLLFHHNKIDLKSRAGKDQRGIASGPVRHPP